MQRNSKRLGMEVQEVVMEGKAEGPILDWMADLVDNISETKSAENHPTLGVDDTT
jgi:hypothetical protein